ncbi:hypothetical protein AMATHDRAFT_71094 [Amanita thiersii Skay4041]|uniref:Uncharacterized protein n=1 Tax=Amanita thiersii Skay4041 TaxID=703135 RepID=A0A2A9N7Z6_9AGAR|nr:hypothetical protein AMATHDRAFT_71094 [Amanita thiersii Skay4041]
MSDPRQSFSPARASSVSTPSEHVHLSFYNTFSCMNSSMEHAWHLTAIRVQGLRLLRPEKSWRPIITVEIDNHHAYEFCMGCDGQNPNLKDTFTFHNASPSSIILLKIWHRSQSKKKHKKRNLVATASHTLGDLIKRQELDHKLEIRMLCQNPTKKAISCKGKPQSGALLHVRLRAPPLSPTTTTDIKPSESQLTPPPSPPIPRRRGTTDTEAIPESDTEPLIPDSGYFSDQHGPASPSSSSSSSSDTLRNPPATPPQVPLIPSGLRKRRRIRGYALFSDEEPLSEDYISSRCPSDNELDLNVNEYTQDTIEVYCPPESLSDPEEPNSGLQPPNHKHIIHLSAARWFSPSLIPQYVQEIKVPPSMNRAERALASFTMYRELSEAVSESQYQAVFERLQMEWTYVGGLLVALAAVNTAVFSISPDSVFKVNSWARSAIATSSVASGLGIASDAWLLFRYNWASLNTFIHRAKDVFDTYLFFSLQARVPAFCMLLSAISLMTFLSLVAYDVWPEGVLVLCFLIGVMMSLQFVAYGARWCVFCVYGVVGVVRRGGRGRGTVGVGAGGVEVGKQ